MKTVNHNRHYDVEREIIQAMSASLKLMLEDLRAQYQHLQARSERLKESDVAGARFLAGLDRGAGALAAGAGGVVGRGGFWRNIGSARAGAIIFY